MIIKNAVRCMICGSPADKHEHIYRCQANPGHIADLNTGIFSNCAYTPADTVNQDTVNQDDIKDQK